ncbi:MAG: rRNA maturation RNase YbeY [Planctomycetes bacterium]|nr:rRNA maturation RNase YbeY [Planctomycetota bacterium]
MVGSLRGLAPRRRVLEDLRRLASVLAARHGGPVEIEVATMSDAEIRRVNRRHLGHDWATDVVSFPLSAPGAPRLVGTLAVSRDTARREATTRGHSPYDEWMLYVVHGSLHLLGLDDGAPRERARMRRAEAAVLSALGRPHVYGREEER